MLLKFKILHTNTTNITTQMPNSIKNISVFNPKISVALDSQIADFVRKVVTVSREELLAIYLYGEITQESFDEKRSAIKTFIVFEKVSTDLLEMIAPPILLANKEFRLQANIITKDEMLTSSDVFPIEFTDIKVKNYLIYGKDVFRSLTISLEDIRCACERNLKEMLFSMRHYFMLELKNPKNLTEKLTTNFSELLICLDMVIYLRTGFFATSTENIIENVKNELNVDNSPLQTVHEMQQGRMGRGNHTEIITIYNNYLNLIVRTASMVDKFEVYR